VPTITTHTYTFTCGACGRRWSQGFLRGHVYCTCGRRVYAASQSRMWFNAICWGFGLGLISFFVYAWILTSRFGSSYGSHGASEHIVLFGPPVLVAIIMAIYLRQKLAR
jgi:hypothetical protein